MDNNFEIIELPKETWKGVTIPLVTKSDSFYDCCDCCDKVKL